MINNTVINNTIIQYRQTLTYYIIYKKIIIPNFIANDNEYFIKVTFIELQLILHVFYIMRRVIIKKSARCKTERNKNETATNTIYVCMS